MNLPSIGVEAHRRSRLDHITDPQLRNWLQRVARAHAVLAGAVAAYAYPERGGGAGNAGDNYTARLMRGCVTPLHDLVGAALDELHGVHGEIQARMDDVIPTKFSPGSIGKLSVLRARAERGVSLFAPQDAR